MEDIQINFENELRKCTVEELRKIAIEIKIAEDDVKEQTKLQVTRIINNVVDALPDEPQKKEMMKRMVVAAPDRLAQNMMMILLGVVEEPKVNVSAASKVSNADDADMQLLIRNLGLEKNSSSKFRREFKITGYLGDSSSDALNYISLCSQISDGRKKGYTDDEIAMAVKKSVYPGSYLRTYLDSKTDLTLEGMLSFIRSATKEKSAPDLFNDLNKAFQAETEDALQFVIRVMQLREKVILASKAEGSIPYTSEQVQELFLHTIRTGLQDDSIKARIEQFVHKGSKTKDEDIIQQLNIVASEEEERKLKCSNSITKKKLHVSEASVTDSNPLLDVVKELKDEIQSLRKEVDGLKNEKNSDSGSSNKKFTRKWGCEYCVKQNKGSSCRHCFRCGAGDHKIQDCLKE